MKIAYISSELFSIEYTNIARKEFTAMHKNPVLYDENRAVKKNTPAKPGMVKRVIILSEYFTENRD